MRTIHLFAGAGGGLLADLILGHTPVCAVEWDAYCCNRLRELRDDGWFPGLHVHEGDIKLWDPSEWKDRVDCLSAGFPCQPFSVAGKQRSDGDERNGWPATINAIRIIRPEFAFLENVPGLISLPYWATILGDLATAGYDAQWIVLGASDVGAPHQRKRLWILATRADSEGQRCGEARGLRPDRPSDGIGGIRQNVPDAQRDARWLQPITESGCSSEAEPRDDGQTQPLADAHGIGWNEGSNQVRAGQPVARRSGEDLATANGQGLEGLGGWLSAQSLPAEHRWWPTEPDVGRVAHGVAARTHRIKALGNGQVPLTAALAWRLLGGPVSA